MIMCKDNSHKRLIHQSSHYVQLVLRRTNHSSVFVRTDFSFSISFDFIFSCLQSATLFSWMSTSHYLNVGRLFIKQNEKIDSIN